MKTLTFLHKGGYTKFPVIVDYKNNTIETLNTIRAHIDNIYVAPEDIEIRYKKDGKEIVTKAKKGDIILTFYNDPTIVNPVAVIKNTEWKENVTRYLMEKAADQARQETRASLCGSCGCDGDCDSCN